MGTHGTEHAKGQIGATGNEIEKGFFGNQQDGAGFNGPGVGGVAGGGGKRGFGERFAGAKDMDDLFLTGRIDAMDVDCAALHHIETLRIVALSKEVLVAVYMAQDGNTGDGGNILTGETGKQLAAPQCASDTDELEIRRGGHASAKSAPDRHASHVHPDGSVSRWEGDDD